MFNAWPLKFFETTKLPAGMEAMMLAPWVIAMRAPIMMLEAGSSSGQGQESKKAVAEKTAAIFESYAAVNIELIEQTSKLVTRGLLGHTPDAFTISRSIQDIADASMAPTTKRVRANYKRLKKQSR